VVTIEDIVEEVVGEIADEFDPDYRYIDRLSDGAWLVDGRLPVSDSRDKLGLDIEESEEYDTLAGWVLSRLGHIPVVGETVRAANGEVRVQLVRRRRVARLKVTVVGLGGETADGEGEERG
jgi:putative hemolysin